MHMTQDGIIVYAGPNSMALLTVEFCTVDHPPLAVQAPNFYACCVSEKCLVIWSSHAHKQNSLVTCDLRAEFLPL